jgi:Cysteine-rich CPXCG
VIESVTVDCPACGEPVELSVDTSVPEQEYVEDCTVCCRPMAVTVSCRPGRVLRADVSPS